MFWSEEVLSKLAMSKKALRYFESMGVGLRRFGATMEFGFGYCEDIVLCVEKSVGVGVVGRC